MFIIKHRWLKICCIVFGTLAFLSCPVALMFRADTREELAIGQTADAIVGLLFAGVVFFSRLPVPTSNRRRWLRSTIIWVTLVFAVTAGPLMLLHAAVAKIRFTVSPTMLTTNRILMIRGAMTQYVRDCGTPPTVEKGLSALYANPGVKGWAGPYLEEGDLNDGWGLGIRYGVRNGRLQIWSCGRDGQSGNDDDVVTELDPTERGL
jgi:hypothetical protein